ncbi:hypothetical protein L2E82_01216 [Cichorium intybus]|uniref:Uncharacterized protein n=1 Tax=Cichorium intybus TaxID=13427 RepID=A0ACB9GZE3_CICIN|nr:hypothetical protein L2E82_01216 [Cichorium intybus]
MDRGSVGGCFTTTVSICDIQGVMPYGSEKVSGRKMVKYVEEEECSYCSSPVLFEDTEVGFCEDGHQILQIEIPDLHDVHATNVARDTEDNAFTN